MKAVIFFRMVPICLAVLGFVAFDSNAATSKSAPSVKLSASGICHDKDSAWFNSTNKYQAFDTVALCIAHGGRLPKAKTQPIDKATVEAIEQERAFVTLYNRNDWPHWLDDDNDCQNTRHELLIQTSTTAVTFNSEKQCYVLTGQWYDPYSNQIFTDSRELDLDHLVPLKFAHSRGANHWDRQQKALFANDRDNLILAKASLNRQKGAKGLPAWLPPNHQYRCQYIAHFNKIMNKYGLIYISSEQRIVNRLVKACAKAA